MSSGGKRDKAEGIIADCFFTWVNLLEEQEKSRKEGGLEGRNPAK